MAEAGWSAADVQWTTEQLGEWLVAGTTWATTRGTIPASTGATTDEQRRQVRLAHERLTELVGRPIDVFAWPNGDAAPAAGPSSTSSATGSSPTVITG